LHIDLCYKEPEGTVLKLSESSDPPLAGTAMKHLGSMQDTRALALLLKLLAEPGRRDQNVIIGGLDSTKDPRAVDTLRKIM
jgi:hypothetical protein